MKQNWAFILLFTAVLCLIVIAACVSLIGWIIFSYYDTLNCVLMK
jgi:hypothetical protein